MYGREFFEEFFGILRFFDNSIRILWEFFGNSIGILWEFYQNSIGILSEFFGNSIGILWKFYRNSLGMCGLGVLNVCVLIMGDKEVRFDLMT